MRERDKCKDPTKQGVRKEIGCFKLLNVCESEVGSHQQPTDIKKSLGAISYKARLSKGRKTKEKYLRV